MAVFDTNKIEIRITKPFVQCKFSEDTKLAGKSIDEIEELPIHLQLKCFRLRAVHTIVETLENQMESKIVIELENEYFRSEEYQEILARKFLDKQLPGEKMVVLPENSEKAKNKHVAKEEEIAEKRYSNFEKWMMYLFPNY